MLSIYGCYTDLRHDSHDKTAFLFLGDDCYNSPCKGHPWMTLGQRKGSRTICTSPLCMFINVSSWCFYQLLLLVFLSTSPLSIFTYHYLPSPPPLQYLLSPSAVFTTKGDTFFATLQDTFFAKCQTVLIFHLLVRYNKNETYRMIRCKSNFKGSFHQTKQKPQERLCVLSGIFVTHGGNKIHRSSCGEY